VEGKGNKCKFFVGNAQGKIKLGKLDVYERIILKITE
jgi:hypothetical protein